LNNSNCDYECGDECLNEGDIIYKVKDICLSKACQCTINIFFEGRQCDYTCANNCLLLPIEDTTRINKCFHQCGCNNETISKVQNTTQEPVPVAAATTLFSGDIQTGSSLKKTITNVSITAVMALFVVGTFYTLNRVKKNTTKGQLVKKSEIKKERKEKMIDEEETFEVEEKYERVV
jgi:hypothetical protein